MFSYNDFLTATNKIQFIQDTINSFMFSDDYNNGITAYQYYKGENTKILNRMNYFYNAQGSKEQDNFKANNRIPSNFFNYITQQLTSYLLGNGVVLDDEIKDKLGKKFDKQINKACTYSQIFGVSYLYCYLNKLGKFSIDVWKGCEFIPLVDDKTNIIKGGIRIIQNGTNKVYIDFYEEDGFTQLVMNDNKLVLLEEKQAYKVKKRKTKLYEEVIEESNWSSLPIIPMYCNDIHSSMLTKSLKRNIDLYDIILSDFGNNLEDSVDVYWVLKNYDGENLETFLQDYKEYKTIKVASDIDGQGDATPHTIDVPYQARKEALEILRKQIYENSMALDMNSITGSSLTTVAIKSAFANLDLKADNTEFEIIDTIENILVLFSEFIGQDLSDTPIKLIRRTLVNDKEIIENLMKIRSDISLKTFLELNPYIEDVEEELKRIEEENNKMFETSLNSENNDFNALNDMANINGQEE